MLRGATRVHMAGPAAPGARGGAWCSLFYEQRRRVRRSPLVAADPAAPLEAALAAAHRDVARVLDDPVALALLALGGELAHRGQVLPGQLGLLGVVGVDGDLEGLLGLLDHAGLV